MADAGDAISAVTRAAREGDERGATAEVVGSELLGVDLTEDVIPQLQAETIAAANNTLRGMRQDGLEGLNAGTFGALYGAFLAGAMWERSRHG